jgi:uncharacterized protein (TIGR02246 family)
MKCTLTFIGLGVLAGAGVAIVAGGAGAQHRAATAASATAVQPESGSRPAANPDEKAIVEGVGAFAKLYSSADVAGLADLFLDDAAIVDAGGNTTRGKAAVTEMYATAFQDSLGLTIDPKVTEVRFLTRDVARVEGRSHLSSETSDADEFTRFSVLLVRRDGAWKISEIREYAAPAADVPPYERLKDLAWMVGEWVDEGDNNRVQSEVRWADNRSYLVRTYKIDIRGVKSSSGTMFIGWDPQSGQIKSWVFDSNGGHGEGLWTRTGDNEWIVKAEGVQRDGQPTSATQIHTIINKDSVKTSSVDRIIGGQIAPDILDVVMVRRAPRPGAAAAAPKAAAAERPR